MEITKFSTFMVYGNKQNVDLYEFLSVERKIRKGRKVSSAFTLTEINNTEHKL